MVSGKIEQENYAVHLDIMETAPHNYGHNGKYEGVGAHLFAFACKMAEDAGVDLVYFDAKTKLIKYYEQKVGAKHLFDRRMAIEGLAFKELIEKYYGKK